MRFPASRVRAPVVFSTGRIVEKINDCYKKPKQAWQTTGMMIVSGEICIGLYQFSLTDGA
jgi:hypothetical protein